MKRIQILFVISSLFVSRAAAQVGEPYIHDPSTIAECDGKYYTFGTGGGLGGGHNGRILTMWNKTLDPKSPDFKWTEAVEVCASDGTYFGTIRLIELDPNTGYRVKGNKEKDIAIDCEATDNAKWNFRNH